MGAFAVLAGLALPALPAAAAVERRDPVAWPFAATSIWNTPVGRSARLVDARLAVDRVGVHVDWLVVPGPARRAPALRSPEGQEPCPAGGARPIPLSQPLTLTVLGRDRSTLTSYAVTARCPDRGPLTASELGRAAVAGNGLTAGTGAGAAPAGSASAPATGTGPAGIEATLAGIGGTLRAGELFGPLPLRHALKLELPARFLSGTPGQGRWPLPAGTRSGSRSGPAFTGTVPALRPGALLALPADRTPGDLGLRTRAGAALLAALRDYGAYVAGDTGEGPARLHLERQALSEYRDRTGVAPERNAALQADLTRLLGSLAVVDDNGPRSVGGAGARRAPAAPPLPRSWTAALRSAGPGSAPPGGQAGSGATAGVGEGAQPGGAAAPGTVSGSGRIPAAGQGARLEGATLWAAAGAALTLFVLGLRAGRRVAGLSPAGRRRD